MPAGVQKGIPNFSVLRMVAEALTDKITRADAIARLQETMKNRRTVLQSLEFAARVNREIGLGSDDRPPGITITFVSNLKPGSLKRQYPAETIPKPRALLKAQTPSTHDRLKRRAERR